MENVFKINFYNKGFLIVSEWFFELLPEIFLLFFILYTLISMFNDRINARFQFYKLFLLLFFVYCILLLQLLFFSFDYNLDIIQISTKVILGFA